MSGKKNSLQRRIRNFLAFNIYINSHNHRLVSCLPHLMKNIDYAEVVWIKMLCYWACGKCLTFPFPKKGAILEPVQNIYGKKPLKMLKGVVT